MRVFRWKYIALPGASRISRSPLYFFLFLPFRLSSSFLPPREHFAFSFLFIYFILILLVPITLSFLLYRPPYRPLFPFLFNNAAWQLIADREFLLSIRIVLSLPSIIDKVSHFLLFRYMSLLEDPLGNILSILSFSEELPLFFQRFVSIRSVYVPYSLIVPKYPSCRFDRSIDRPTDALSS